MNEQATRMRGFIEKVRDNLWMGNEDKFRRMAAELLESFEREADEQCAAFWEALDASARSYRDWRKDGTVDEPV